MPSGSAAHRVVLDPGFVLHQRPWRESSLIVEVFSAHSGRIGLVARGARRPASPLRGLLQPFIPLLISWLDRTELGTLRGAEPDGPVLPLTGKALAGGLYMNELLMRLTHRHDPHPELLEDYRQALLELHAREDFEPVLRVFEKRLLSAIGYGLLLDRQGGNDHPVRADRSYRYRPEFGPVEGGDARTPGVDVSGATLLALAEERLASPEERSEAKRLMRYLLEGLLGPRPLGARMLFRARTRN